MPWPGLDKGLEKFGSGEWPTLLVAADWIENHCVVPDGFRRGQRFELVRWQLWALLSFYRLKPEAREGQLATAFHSRRSQIVLPQKAGKAPYTAAHICLEGVGPSLFAGWAKGGERWTCAEHGCGCGWWYPYSPGEPMAQERPTSLIQVTAFSEKQTDNIYSALKPMIDEGPLHPLIPKTGEEFIRLPRNGRIDVVTSEARSRLGARVTFVPQDETGIWTESAKMIIVAETQRRGLAGMGGRAEETTNAWDPNQGSVAQRTAEAAKKTGDIFRLHPLPEKGLSYKAKDERRKIHKDVYAGCEWIDLDGIEGEAAELIILDAAQAERFFGNRPVAGAGVAFDITLVEACKRTRLVKLPDADAKVPRVQKGSLIVIGVDGALNDDALAMVATDIKTGFTWPLCILERPENAPEDYEHDQSIADGAMVEVMEAYRVWRVYIDDQWIDKLVEKWTNRYGNTRIVVWRTNRPRWMAPAVRELEQAVADGAMGREGGWTYDGNPTLTAHFANAQKAEVNVLDDKERPMHILAKDSKDSPRKKDGADASVIAWKARSDAVELGIVPLEDRAAVPDPVVPRPKTWVPGTAPPLEMFQPVEEVSPMGGMF